MLVALGARERALHSWLFAIRFGLSRRTRENDLLHIASGAETYAVFAALQFIALSLCGWIGSCRRANVTFFRAQAPAFRPESSETEI